MSVVNVIKAGPIEGSIRCGKSVYCSLQNVSSRHLINDLTTFFAADIRSDQIAFDGLRAIAVRPDTGDVACATDDGPALFDAESFQAPALFDPEAGEVGCVRYSPDGKRLALGGADSTLSVYDADSLKELSKHETQEVFHGAGGIGYRNNRFFVVGGLPDSVQENYVYEYDQQFKFLKKHIIKSGHTHLGIQTATYAHNRWWFGCYGSPQVLLVTDSDFNMKGRYEIDCSLGVEGMTKGRLLIAGGKCDRSKGCTGNVKTALPDDKKGFLLPVPDKPQK